MAGQSDFAGLVAVVIGGASGIGRATVQELSRRGAQVAVIDRAAPGDLAADVARFTADVSCQEQVDLAVEQVVERWAGLDVLVNCAGVEARGTLETIDDTNAAEVLDVNVLGMVRTMRAALPHLKASPRGAIVNLSSVAAVRGMAGLAVYSASKGAVLALTRSVAAELLPHGVRVNCVSPGTVDTPWIGRLLDSSSDPDVTLALIKARQPHGRLIDPVEVATAIAYLASPLAPSITGTSLDVDGGLVALSQAQDVSSGPETVATRRMT